MPTPVQATRRQAVAYAADFTPTPVALYRPVPKLEVVPAPPMPSGRAAATPTKGRAERLVSRAEMDHYMRQGERIADALLAIQGAFARLLEGFRRNRHADRPRLRNLTARRP
jgi:hypothetical protein